MEKSPANKQTTNLTITSLISIMMVLISIIFSAISASADKKITIAITKIIDHPSLNNSERGIIDALAEAGYHRGKNLDLIIESANGSVATANQIAQKFTGIKPDVIVAISTISAQTCAKAAKNSNIPIVFSSVTNPKEAGLVDKDNITGATDAPPLEQAIKLIKEIIPGISKLGVVYNSGDNGSVSTVAELKALKSDLTIIEAIATSSNEVSSAVKSLIGKIEALYIPLDNTVVGALETVLKVTNAAKIPVFSNDPAHVHHLPVITNNTDDVSRGILAAIGFTQYEVGRVAGTKIVQILKGSKAGDIAVSAPDNYELHINLDSAKLLGIELPLAVIKRANKIIGAAK